MYFLNLLYIDTIVRLTYKFLFFFSVDRTEKGHVLGPAARLGPLRAPERKLNRASCAVLRLLTHMSMYIGANVNEQVKLKHE